MSRERKFPSSIRVCRYVLGFMGLCGVFLETQGVVGRWFQAQENLRLAHGELERTKELMAAYYDRDNRRTEGRVKIDAHNRLSISDIVAQVSEAARLHRVVELSYESRDRVARKELIEEVLVVKAQGPWQGLLALMEVIQRPPLKLFVKSILVTKSYNQNDVAIEVIISFVKRRGDISTTRTVASFATNGRS